MYQCHTVILHNGIFLTRYWVDKLKWMKYEIWGSQVQVISTDIGPSAGPIQKLKRTFWASGGPWRPLEAPGGPGQEGPARRARPAGGSRCDWTNPVSVKKTKQKGQSACFMGRAH